MLVLGVALSACGATNPAAAPSVHGTLDLARALPAPTPTPFAVHGTGETSAGSYDRPDARAAIAPYLRARQAKASRPALAARATPATRATRVLPVAHSAPAVASTTRAEAAPAAPAPGDSQLAARTQSANEPTFLASKQDTSRSDAERYSGRQSRELEGYRGGDVIVITASTLIIILLVAVVILLLT